MKWNTRYNVNGTPLWQSTLPHILHVLQNGSALSKREAREALEHIAQAADAWVLHCEQARGAPVHHWTEHCDEWVPDPEEL